MKIITSTADISIEELENTSGEIRIHDEDSYSISIQKNYNASTLIKIKKAINASNNKINKTNKPIRLYDLTKSRFSVGFIIIIALLYFYVLKITTCTKSY